MKTNIFRIIVAIVISGSLSNISAQDTSHDKLTTFDHSQGSIYIDTNNLVALVYQCQFEGDRSRLVVRIFDEAGYQICFCQLKNKKAAKVSFDLSQFDDGTYDVRLYENKNLICSKSIQKETQAHTFVVRSALLEKPEALSTLSLNELD